MRELPLRRQHDGARVRRDLAANCREESRLAAAVRADEPRFVADGKRETRAVKQLFRAARKRQIGNAQHVKTAANCRLSAELERVVDDKRRMVRESPVLVD